jgi:hypothetical protein
MTEVNHGYRDPTASAAVKPFSGMTNIDAGRLKSYFRTIAQAQMLRHG